jgi:hypothetical protein
MTCPSVEELAALFDRSLSKDLLVELREHVALCPRCANEIKVMQRITKIELTSATPPQDLYSKAISRTKPNPKLPQAKKRSRSKKPRRISF